MMARATELGESTKYLKSLSIIAAHNIIYINNWPFKGPSRHDIMSKK